MMEAPGFFVEDLFDLSNDDEIIGDNFLFTHSSTGSSLTAPNSCISTDSNILPDFPNSCFAQGLPVPYDDLREIDWLSNLVDGSFAPNDFGMTTGPVTRPEPDSRRNLQARIPTPKEARRKKKLSRRGPMIANAGPGPGRKARRRRCLHCAAERTPQWRAGPKGPKTLCNACGVRFKSGRLVPEYRPAASPSFVPTKHSNSHRKVLEMRRQKEGGKSRPRRTRVYFGRNPPRSGVL